MGKPSRNERFSSAILDYPENNHYIVFFWDLVLDTFVWHDVLFFLWIVCSICSIYDWSCCCILNTFVFLCAKVVSHMYMIGCHRSIFRPTNRSMDEHGWTCLFLRLRPRNESGTIWDTSSWLKCWDEMWEEQIPAAPTWSLQPPRVTLPDEDDRWEMLQHFISEEAGPATWCVDLDGKWWKCGRPSHVQQVL